MRATRLLLLACLVPACHHSNLAADMGGDPLGGLGIDFAVVPSAPDFAAGPKAWQPEPSGTSQDLLGIWGSSASDIYVVGRAGTILHSTGDGHWSAQASGVTSDISAIWGSSATDLY